ncbi:MAG: class IV adenylate cyclase [Acidobacteriaceae bacterium]
MSKETPAGKFEIEIKARLSDRAVFAAKLPTLGFRLKTPETFERNVLFDTPEGLLRSRRELLRIREYGGKWKLTHKADTDAASPHKVRVETELEISDGPAMAAILERLGYQRVFVYEKRRTEWADDKGHIVLDATPIGDFVELEGKHAWIDETAKKLGIQPSQYLTASYARLFFDWRTANHHPANNMTFAEASASRRDLSS